MMCANCWATVTSLLSLPRTPVVWGEGVGLGQQSLHFNQRARSLVRHHLRLRQRRRAKLEDN